MRWVVAVVLSILGLLAVLACLEWLLEHEIRRHWKS